MAPTLQEARFALQRHALRVLSRTWRPDAGALRYFKVEEPIIVDVGANRGFSISGFLMLKSKARIVAFEPLPELAAILRVRYEKSPNVIIHSCALGSADGQMTIYIPIYRGYMFDALASLDYDEAANWVNPDRLYFFNAEKIQINKEHVKVFRLDNFSIEPDIIKINAQGHEPAVLRGGETTIQRYEPAIMVPARIPRLDACLRDFGYTRYAFLNSKLYLEAEGHTFSWYIKRKHLALFSCHVEKA